MNKTKCELCDSEKASILTWEEPEAHDTYLVECPGCGNYELSKKLSLQSLRLTSKQKTLISAHINLHQKGFDDFFDLTQDKIDSIITQPFPTPAERAEYLLTLLCQSSNFIGDGIIITSNSTSCPCPIPIEQALSASFSRFETELDFLLIEYLNKDKHYILCSQDFPNSYSIQITSSGWAHYHDLMRGEIESNKVFIASWFNELTKPTIQAVKDVLKDMNYRYVDLSDPHAGGTKPGFINEQILVEIKSSKFIVADLTSDICEHHQDDEGKIIPQALARGGVYFEAGYAKGLGKEVILLCEKDFEKKNLVHFDLKQHRYITWDAQNLDPLKKDLAVWIENNFGQGKSPIL